MIVAQIVITAQLVFVLAASVSQGRNFNELHAHELKRTDLHEESVPNPCEPGSAADFDFLSAELLKNNLGGKGPWEDPGGEQTMRFGSLIIDEKINNGRPVDLIVSVMQGSKYGFAPGKHRGNGFAPGKLYGQIGVNAGSSVDLNFTLVSKDTDSPAVLDDFLLSFLDLDSGGDNTAKETLTIGGFQKYDVSKDTEIDIGKTKDGRSSFTSTKAGLDSDNPTDPLELTPVQANRAVTFKFVNVHEVLMTFAVGRAKYAHGRKFFFAGRASMPCSGQTPTTTTTTACVSRTDPLPFSFSSAVVLANNLGGKGPKSGNEETLRFGKIAKLNDAWVDLVVTATSAYAPGGTKQNGVKGEYGNIAMKAGSVVDFDFELVLSQSSTPFASQSSTPAKVESFYFSIYDLDMGLKGRAGEILIVDGFEKYFVSKDTELSISEGSYGTRFAATTFGDVTDNPSDPLKLTSVQANRAVTFLFKGVSKFSMTFSVGSTQYAHDRFFLFAGRSSVVKEDCSPTAPPSSPPPSSRRRRRRRTRSAPGPARRRSPRRRRRSKA